MNLNHQRKVKAVLFDLDGTLVDTLEDLSNAVNHMLKSFKKTKLEVSTIKHLIGKGSLDLTQRALQTDSPDEIERGMKLLLEFNTKNIAVKSRLYPGASNILEKLSSDGIIMAIVSNKNESLSRLILNTLEIEHFFAIICGGDTYPVLKPSPLPLLHVAERLGLTPDQVVMVGDSINDITAGNLAGVTTIGCDWGFGGDEEIIDAAHKASSLNEVYEILRCL